MTTRCLLVLALLLLVFAVSCRTSEIPVAGPDENRVYFAGEFSASVNKLRSDNLHTWDQNYVGKTVSVLGKIKEIHPMRGDSQIRVDLVASEKWFASTNPMSCHFKESEDVAALTVDHWITAEGTIHSINERDDDALYLSSCFMLKDHGKEQP